MCRESFVAVALGAIVVGASAVAYADLEPCWCSSPTRWGGGEYRQVVSDGVTPQAVAVANGALLLLDLREPAAPGATFPGSSDHHVPQRLGWSLSLPAVTGDTLVGAVDDDLVLLDLRVADQTWNPVATVTGVEPRAVAADDGRAAVLTASLELQLYDVHQPQAPLLLGTGELAVATSESLMALDGDLAVLAARGAPLYVVDLQNPSSPAVIGATGAFADPFAEWLQLDAGRAYYCSRRATGEATVHIVDLAMPAAPQLVGELGGETCHVQALASRLYWRQSGGRAQVWDVTLPSQPTLLGTVPASGRRGLAVAGESLVSAGGLEGVYVTRLAPTAESVGEEIRVRARSYGFGYHGWHVVLRGSRLFALERDRVWALDVSDSTAPKELGWWDGAGAFLALAAAGRALLVLDAGGRVTALDASDPGGLTATSELLADTGARVVIADGGRAAVAGDHLVELATLDAAGNLMAGATVPVAATVQPATIAIAGRYLTYYAREPGSDGWLHVLDISDPAAPVELVRLSPSNDLAPGMGVDEVSDVEAAGGEFYVVSTGYGWGSQYSFGVVLDPQSAGLPQLGGSFAALVDVELHGSVFATGNPQFLATPSLLLVDLREPERRIDPYPPLLWECVDGLSVTDGRRLFTISGASLQVFDFGCCRLPEVFSDFLESADTTAWSTSLPE